MRVLAPICPSVATTGAFVRPFGRVAVAYGLVALVACARGPAATPLAEAPVPAAPGVPGGAPPVDGDQVEAPLALEGVSHPGCFMLLALDDGPPRLAGEQPCDQRTIPASTFKIPHALIALDTGMVTDVDALVAWDGRKGWLEAWNHDHSLRTAIYESVVWFFQGTARAIGRERMREYLQAFDYGNAEVEGAVDMFWLDDGSLEISAPEQLRFMARLYRDQLPRGRSHVPTLRELLVRPVESFRARMPEGTPLPKVHPELVFSAKTGTGAIGEQSVTWMVGHVRCPAREHVFVSRMIAPGEPQVISPAVIHGLAALDRSGVLRCEE
jgi:beta-lactamase class D